MGPIILWGGTVVGVGAWLVVACAAAWQGRGPTAKEPETRLTTSSFSVLCMRVARGWTSGGPHHVFGAGQWWGLGVSGTAVATLQGRCACDTACRLSLPINIYIICTPSGAGTYVSVRKAPPCTAEPKCIGPIARGHR